MHCDSCYYFEDKDKKNAATRRLGDAAREGPEAQTKKRKVEEDSTSADHVDNFLYQQYGSPPCLTLAGAIFEASLSFTGKRDGFVFKTGPKGLGARTNTPLR
jgi:hypothetical protein